MTAIPSALPLALPEQPTANLEQLNEYRTKLAEVRNYLLAAANYFADSRLKVLPLINRCLEFVEKKEEEITFKIRLLRIVQQLKTGASS